MGEFTFRLKLRLKNAASKKLVAFFLCIPAWFSVYAQTPVASFTADTTTGCVPLTVNFINQSVLATNYFWRFRNGNTSTLPNPSATYTLPGNYSVTLIATNSTSGQVDSVTIPNFITVVNYPTANFTTTNTDICKGGSVCFTNTSVNATNYAWDFGDGNSSTQANPCHQYATAGTYTVKLIAYSTFSCNDIKIKPAYITVHSLPNAQISCNQTSSCDVTQAFSFTCPTAGGTSWQWNFGDPASGVNNTSSLQNPTHVFSAIGSYTVSLIVTNSFGCSDTLVNTNYINIGNSLVPNFNVNATGGCAPFTANFSCPIPNATSWQWNFGDPGSGASNASASQTPNHIYSNPGQYTITLTVNTASGCNGTATYTNYITVDQMPTANFTITNNTGCAPASIQFNNTSSASATTWLWDFGNSNTSTLQNPTNTYNATGTYTVTLNAYTPNGCHAIQTVNNAVTIYGAVAGLQGNPKIGCAPLTSNFSANPYAGTISWLWDFGDPSSGASNTSTLQATTHTFNTPGLYAIKLITTTNHGCVDTFKVNGYIKVYSGMDLHTVDSIGGCTPLPVSFTDPTLGSTQWHWDFGDSTVTNDTSNIKNPSYIYNNPGTYTVTLVTNMPGGATGTGCQQTFNPYAVVTVLPLIVSPITFVQASPCAPFLIQFSDTTSGVAHWSWTFGDGSPADTNQFPTHTYQQPGTYNVVLQIEMLTGCMTSVSTSITVGHPNPISISNHGPCKNATVNYSVNNAAVFSNVTWTFGDGSLPSNLFNTTHAYSSVGNYAVSLSTTDISGCVYTYHDTVKVTNPQASFNIPGPMVGCGLLNVNFNNTSTGGGTYVWNFGDGDSSALQNPTHLYDSVGTYTVTLTASNYNCVRSYSFPTQITIGNAVADFSMSQNSYCDPVSATFTDLSTNPVYWHWDFGNGDTSNLQNPTYVYTAPPTGNVTLIISDNNGCSDTISKPNVIYLHAAFSVDDSAGCHPFIAHFTDLSDSSAVSWHWVFGDGTTSNQHNPTHTFIAPHDTTYTVTLITTFASGCSDTVRYSNFINISSPQADFTTPTVAACAPSLINYTNLSTQAVSYEWDFGDQVTSTLIDPSHIYNIPGYYTITLIATDAMGCSDTMSKPNYIYIPGTYSYFNINTLSYCFGTTVQLTDSSINAMQWHWDFGDGYSDSSQNPLHVYADTGCYTISLITSDSIGCSSNYTSPTPVCVHPIPTANATTADTVGCKSFTSSFTELAQNENAYLWMFGDGDTSTLANPSHLYNSAGVYNVSLVAYNQWGCTDTFSIATPIVVNQTPVAQFTKSTSSGCNPLTVQFNNTSIDTVNSIYNWSFGDGQFSSLANPNHIFADSGIYTIQLIVTNTGNCSDTSYSTVTVHKTPTASATTANITGCSPFAVTFSNQSVGATSYLWKFGDTQTSAQATPTHVYADSGTYYVQLIAIASFGCRDTFHFLTPIIVNKTPVAAFTPSITSGCNPLSVSFNNNSVDTVNSLYSWSFGDGQVSSSINSTNTYADSGHYSIQLVVVNSGNCSDTTYTFVDVHKTPTANGSTVNITGCSPFTVNFNNASVDANSYLWIFGDNQTSTQANPVHVYADSGVYSVQLIANTTFGCSDTFNFVTPITVNKTPVAAFTPASLIACAPANVTFTNTSIGTFNPVFNWSIDTLSSSNALNPFYTFVDSGSYNITLLITNQGGCVDSISHGIQVLPKPTAIASTTDTMGCNPHTSTFTNNSIDADSYLWNFGDTSTDTSAVPSHVYVNAGAYNVSLIAYNAIGCTDTLYLHPPITVEQTPSANFTVASSAQCSGSFYNFTNLSTDTINPVYLWTIGSTITSGLSDPSFQLINPGFYDVSLAVTNSNGCTDSLTKPFYILVYDTLPPPADPLQSVSVVDDNSVRITWMNSMAVDLAEYRLYRLDPLSGNYINVYTDTNPSNASFNPTSSYTETGLNTLQNTYTYKLQTADRCSYALPLDSLLEHRTVNATATTSGKDIDVNWTPYGGCSISTYIINRVEVGSSVSTVVGSVPGTQLSFTDTTLQCPFPYSYRIQGIDLCGDTATTWSDTSTAVPINQLENQHADIVRSTVVFDRSVLTEWAVPVLHPERVIAYNILRSTDSVNYYQVTQVPTGNTSYVDDDVLVHEQHYYYKIDVVNDCNLTGSIETNSSSILLKGEWLNDHSHLWWTKYDKWDTGVDHYSIEKINKYGQWEEIKIVPGNGSTDIEIDE